MYLLLLSMSRLVEINKYAEVRGLKGLSNIKIHRIPEQKTVSCILT